GGRLPTGAVLRLKPPVGLEVPGERTVGGRVALTLVAESQDPFVIFGAVGGTRVQAVGISAAITAELDWTAAEGKASADVGVAADLTGAELVVDAAESDGFLRSVLPADGLRTRFDAGLAWSQRRGLTFRGSAGLDTTLA